MYYTNEQLKAIIKKVVNECKKEIERDRKCNKDQLEKELIDFSEGRVYMSKEIIKTIYEMLGTMFVEGND